MKTKKILLIFVFTLLALLISTTKAQASQYLNNLDFFVQINSDGSMDVTENWDIKISDTNTLYKTFRMDSSKYSEITNVVVTEVGKQELIPSDEWAYHMKKGYYYGGLNNDGDYEICWGVGLDDSSDKRNYKISYKVLDAIAKYNDVAELYWQFIGSSFEISAANITGTIKLPEGTGSIEDIKVWGHVDTLNGEIYATSANTVDFNLNNFRSGRYVEIRVAFPTNLVDHSGRTYNQNRLGKIISEETVWANEANMRREKQQRIDKLITIGTLVVGTVFSFLLLIQTIKYIKVLKTTEKLKPIQKLEYFREIPGKDKTPADAVFIYSQGAQNNYKFGETFSATLLNLSLKGYFKVEMGLNEKGKEQVYIERLKEIEDLNYEEEKIARFVKNAIGNKEKITIKELQKYIKNHPTSVSKLIEETQKMTLSKNKNNGNYDEKNVKKKDKYVAIGIIYFIFAFFILMFSFTLGLEVSKKIIITNCVLLVLNAILSFCINSKLSKLTQKGIDEKEKWKGLKKYMEDFSLLNEKEVPALTLWEEFLVYATAFGIADRVIKQLKLVYPEIENMDNFNTGSYVYLMSHTNFNSSFNSAINSSISSTMSSGSGGGGGFSGGGGFGRRPEEADGGR